MPHVELPQTEFKAVILGDTHVGKTSLVLRFTEGYYREGSRKPTIGAFFLTNRVQTSSGITAKVQIWDTAGQRQFRQMAPIYWRNSAAILVCYDVSNAESLNVALEWMKELRGDKDVLEKNIVLALVGLKSDLLNAIDDDNADVGYYDDINNDGNDQKSQKQNIVSMAQVEQALQSFNNQGHWDAPTSAANSETNKMSSVISPNHQNRPPFSNSSNSVPTPDNYPTQSPNHFSLYNGNNENNYINNMSSPSPPKQQRQPTSQHDHGQILHICTSARQDQNIDILFQKIAEEVLFVREQERTLWMNHGIKYKHYSNISLSGNIGGVNGNTSMNLNQRTQQQHQQSNQYNSYMGTSRDDHLGSPPQPTTVSMNASASNQEHQLDLQGTAFTTTNNTTTPPRSNIRNLTIDTTNIKGNSYSSYDRSYSKDDVYRRQSVETFEATSSFGDAGRDGGFCCASTSNDELTSCTIS